MIKNANRRDLIDLEHFVQATRDAGYKGTAAALAELIDNSFEADATEVNITIGHTNSSNVPLNITVVDNGCGMLPSTLRVALRFGGSTRFNSRQGTGRYGMGLPNSSLSRARRVDVYSWTSPRAIWWSYLDLDEIVAGGMKEVPKVRRAKLPVESYPSRGDHGTVIAWSNCDRIEFKSIRFLSAKLKQLLGRIFRWQLWAGKSIKINGDPVQPVDPLFLMHKIGGSSATLYGETLNYEILVPTSDGGRSSTVSVRFTELPVNDWHLLTNEEKRGYGITKRAGVSIVRAGREVDYGWFFMGSKRRENYDDWWRCEVSFNPELDELFGVTITKQGIHPTEDLKNMLMPDLERTAKTLNGRVRASFIRIKSPTIQSSGATLAESKDVLLEPPTQAFKFTSPDVTMCSNYLSPPIGDIKDLIKGLKYRVEYADMDGKGFFVPKITHKELVLILNKRHAFYRYVSRLKSNSLPEGSKEILQLLELILFAMARVECNVTDEDKVIWMQELRESWGRTLSSYLS